jgi:hypothetical protein
MDAARKKNAKEVCHSVPGMYLCAHAAASQVLRATAEFDRDRKLREQNLFMKFLFSGASIRLVFLWTTGPYTIAASQVQAP